MSDQAHTRTDRELQELERRIAKVYQEARDDVADQIKAYFRRFQARDAAMQKRLAAGEITEEYYKQWRLNQIGRGRRFEDLRDKLAERFTDAYETAVAYVNDKTPGIYSLNRNYAAYTIEKEVGDVGFTLWDEQTVRRLIVEEPDVMPYYPPKRAVQRGFDLAYGKSQITKNVTSSILQGLSIGQMADSLQARVVTMSRVSAVRAARTAVTAAENAGRMDSYHAAEKMGIKLRKGWLATLDGRTRHAHAILDGQTVDVDKPFKVDGREIRFPGDPQAAPYLAYNCRCSLIASIANIDTSDTQRRAIDPKTGKSVLIKNMSYSEWAGWKTNISEQTVEKVKLSFLSVADAEKWAISHGVKFAIYDGFDLETATTINNAINTLPDGVRPKSITNLVNFKKGFGGKLQRKDSQIYGVTLDNLWGINFKNGMVDLEGGVMVGYNTRNFKNAAVIQASKEKTNEAYKAKTGRLWHFNMSGEATYYHEIGHSYAQLKGIPEGFSKARERWYNEAKCDILKTDSEAWAEVWAAYHLGDNRLPDYIAKFIRGIY